jgi:hypothetical protein
MVLRVLGRRIRYFLWYLSWQVTLRLSTTRSFHDIKVSLYLVLNDQIEAQCFARVEAALDLIARYDPRRLRTIRRSFDRIWIRRTTYAPAYYIDATRLCVIDQRFLIAPETTVDRVAVAIIHEATHARLFRHKIPYAEAMRSRIEVICDEESAAFADRLPDGASLASRIRNSRTDPDHWSDISLERRFQTARQDGIRSAREEMEASDLPNWVKKILRRLGRFRAA